MTKTSLHISNLIVPILMTTKTRN